MSQKSVANIQAKNLAQFGVAHGFFTRHGGCSKNNFSSLNVSFAVGDNPLCVIKNRDLLKSYFNTTRNPIMINMVHEDTILTVDANNYNAACSTYFSPEMHQHIVADAIVTDLPGAVIGIHVADCLPIMFYASDVHQIAIVHSGWRSSLLQISQKTLSLLKNRGANMKNIVAALGPSIHGRSYQVQEEFYQTFIQSDLNNEGFFIKEDRKYYFDNRAYVANSIAKCGVSNIETINIDTFNDNDFFSYRRNLMHQGPKKHTGRFAAMIKLSER